MNAHDVVTKLLLACELDLWPAVRDDVARARAAGMTVLAACWLARSGRGEVVLAVTGHDERERPAHDRMEGLPTAVAWATLREMAAAGVEVITYDAMQRLTRAAARPYARQPPGDRA